MTLDSDQIEDTQEDYIEPEEEITGEVVDPEEDVEPEESGESESEESVEVPAKKSKFVEFTTPEQKERVGQLTREKYEAIRKAQELERRLQQLEKQPEPPKEVKAPSADPVTHPEVYAQEVQAYSQYIKDQTKYEVEQQTREQQRAAAENARKEQMLSVYQQNMQRLKVNPTTLSKAADVCERMGITPELTDHLLEDEDGPALVAYLGSTGVDDLAELVTLKPSKAIAYLERVVREKALKKQISKAPQPPTKVAGTRKPSTTKDMDGWSFR